MSFRNSLIQHLKTNPNVNGVYDVIRCVSFPSGRKRGVFSLVFEATEVATGRKVALKFFDPELWMEAYRVAAFNREPEILVKLLGKKRGLQLVDPLGIEKLSISVTFAGTPSNVDFSFFAVEWLDYELDAFFLSQEKMEALHKLQIFNEILSAIKELHDESIFHRDIKIDNLRATKLDTEKNRLKAKGVVKAIDLGTAARADSPKLLASYNNPVGATLLSPPEAFLGLAGCREIAPATDTYALGCLLYGFFNKNHFQILQKAIPEYRTATAILGAILGVEPEEERLEKWRENIAKVNTNLRTPEIDGPGSSAPQAIADILNNLLRSLTQYDFDRRISGLSDARSSISRAIAILESDLMIEHRKKIKGVWRKNREAKLREKDARLKSMKKEG